MLYFYHLYGTKFTVLKNPNGHPIKSRKVFLQRRIVAKFRMHHIGSLIKLNRISEVSLHERFTEKFIKSWKNGLHTYKKLVKSSSTFNQSLAQLEKKKAQHFSDKLSFQVSQAVSVLVSAISKAQK